MKVKIEVEQLDNGITMRWRDVDGVIDPIDKVIPDGQEEAEIGREIWSDVKSVMDRESSNKATMTILYEVEGKK